MYRSNTCGALNIGNVNQEVVLSGWVHKVRDKGFVAWVDLRDRYGITQLVFDEERTSKSLWNKPVHWGAKLLYRSKAM